MKIRDRVKGLLKNDFNKNFLTLFSGSALAQLIPLLASVILARIYSPEDFGVFAIFTSVVMIFNSVVNLRYEFAIPLAKDDEEAVVVTLLSGIIAIVFSIILFFVFLIFQNQLLILIGGEKLGSWLLLVPLSVFLAGIYNSLNYFSLRLKKYKLIARSNITRSISNAGFQLGLGAFGFSHIGLIFGYLISFLFGNSRMLKVFLKNSETIKKISMLELKHVAIRFKRFPLISIWGIFLNNLSVNVNNFFISRVFGINQLGFYSYSYKYINAPLSLISSNMGQLFYQICATRYLENKPATKEFLATFKRLVLICLPVFIVLFFVVEDLFTLILGQKWYLAGYYCKILIPLFCVRTIYGPLSMITGAFEKQSLSLVLQIIIFMTNIVVVIYSYQFNKDLDTFLKIYSVSGFIVYILLFFVLYRTSKFVKN